MSLEELKAVKLDKAGAFEEVQKRYRDRLNELTHEATRKVNDELGAELEAAKLESFKALKEWRDENDRVAVEAAVSKLPHSEGTRLVEWRRLSYSINRPLVPTGRTAVLQVFRKGDVVPHGTTYVIHPGSIVVRLLKKDGTPGAKVDMFNDSWLPEGVRHPQV